MDFFLLLCMLTAIVTEFRFLNRDKKIILLLVYSCAALFMIFSSNILIGLNYKLSDFFLEGENIFFSIIEYLTFYSFFKQVLESPVLRKLMLSSIFFLAIAFLIYLYRGLYISSTAITTKKIADFITSSELLFLTILCLLYYHKLFRERPVYKLTDSPFFWIATGLFFYSVTIIPFFIISKEIKFIEKNQVIYQAGFAIHYIFFGGLFLTITKAILCEKPLTT